MRVWCAILSLWLTCFGEPASAQDQKTERASCTWERATAVTIEQAAAKFRDWEGKCVRLRALHAFGRYATDNRLLSDRLAVLEHEEPRKHSLVINGHAEIAHKPHRPRWEEVLGTVGSCELAYERVAAMQAADPDNIIMLAGLCHYTLDHFLIPLAYRAVEAPAVTRLRRSELVPAQIELLAVPDSDPSYPERRETGERMFAALEGREFETFLAFDQPEVARDLGMVGEAGLGEADRERLVDSRASFEDAVAAFGAAKIDSQGKRIMLAPRPLEPSAGVDVLNGANATDGAFWCRLEKGASEEELPVRAEDIDNDPSRPFFCVEVGDYIIFRQGKVPHASVPLFEHGFPERTD